jgi:hypothetical protein
LTSTLQKQRGEALAAVSLSRSTATSEDVRRRVAELVGVLLDDVGEVCGVVTACGGRGGEVTTLATFLASRASSHSGNGVTPRELLSLMRQSMSCLQHVRVASGEGGDGGVVCDVAAELFVVGEGDSDSDGTCVSVRLHVVKQSAAHGTAAARESLELAAWGRMFSGVVVSSLSLGGMATLTPPSSLGREEAVVAEAHRRLRIVDDDVASLLRSCAQPEMRAAATTATTATAGRATTMAAVLRRLEAVLRPPEIPEALRLDAGEVEEGAEIGREPFASLYRGRCRGHDVVIRVSGCGRCCDDAVSAAAAWLVIPYWRVHRCM